MFFLVYLRFFFNYYNHIFPTYYFFYTFNLLLCLIFPDNFFSFSFRSFNKFIVCLLFTYSFIFLLSYPFLFYFYLFSQTCLGIISFILLFYSYRGILITKFLFSYIFYIHYFFMYSLASLY